MKNEQEKNSVGNATAIYFNFADVLNVAYSAENSSDIINQTYSLIKNCKFKSSSDIMRFEYNFLKLFTETSLLFNNL